MLMIPDDGDGVCKYCCNSSCGVVNAAPECGRKKKSSSSASAAAAADAEPVVASGCMPAVVRSSSRM